MAVFHMLDTSTGDVVLPIATNAGAPTNGTSGTLAGIAARGSLLLDVTNAVLYQNSNTLASPTWTAPTNGDVVYAGGPAVDTVAAAILSYVDSLGPSRVSGYADSVSPWQDTVEIAQLIRICLDAAASDGTKMLSNILWNGTQALVTINGTTADVQGTDDPVNGPELLYCGHVAVTQ